MSYGGVLSFLILHLIVLVYSAAPGLECRIYVSSSDGINNTSCWTGGVQTPCATIDLAIQGTAALQYNCSSGILINLSPGTYTLDTTSLLEEHNVSIVGSSGNVSVTCLNKMPFSFENWLSFESVSLYNCYDNSNTGMLTSSQSVDCNGTVTSLELHHIAVNPSDSQSCINFRASTHICNNSETQITNYTSPLRVCVDLSSQTYCNTLMPTTDDSYVYNILLLCDNTGDSSNVTLEAMTMGSKNMSGKVTLQLGHECNVIYFGECNYSTCTDDHYCPLSKDTIYNYVHYHRNSYINEKPNDTCHDNATATLCAVCHSDDGVPINMINECINCKEHPLGLLYFVLLEILPITIIVLLIIAFNIQLTNGFLNGLVFFSQVMSIAYAEMILEAAATPIERKWLYSEPTIIFNLDFISMFNSTILPLCITPNMSPLGAISFWYVIGFYPLLLLLLLYVWITLYDKGYKCVVLVTRPFHRCMARFWSMTGIEPSFTHSIASIYILCFTQLAATSFKILRFRKLIHTTDKSVKFFYDATVKYFGNHDHAFAGSFAILVLIILIVLPTLYILLYPFKWFHKLLDRLHLRKQLLISLGDVFTGPYKNGSKNTFDYRFFAGLYLLARLVILFQLFAPTYFAIQITQGSCSLLIAIMILIFRPFQRDIHSFGEVLFLGFIVILSVSTTGVILLRPDVNVTLSETHFLLGFIFNCLVISFLVLYVIYWSCKVCINCYRYYKYYQINNYVNKNGEDQSLIGNDDDWIADRMENPQEYDERHVSVRINDFSQEENQDEADSKNTAAATFGSTTNPSIQVD